MKDSFFIPFAQQITIDLLPTHFMLMADCKPDPLCLLAATELQHYFQTQKEWQHNFGLTDQAKGMVIGKMFGVLVVQNQANEIGYLAAFSGKLAGRNQHKRFVPPIFDTLSESGFLNKGMEALSAIGLAIKNLEALQPEHYQEQVIQLKTKRKNHSIDLQQQIFEHYHFLNIAGEEKSLLEIFSVANYRKPPAGAGECAGPKLLQYAFQQRLKPIAIAEFWWGQSPKSATWKHGHFYPCCKEKCEPILSHMLKGIELNTAR